MKIQNLLRKEAKIGQRMYEAQRVSARLVAAPAGSCIHLIQMRRVALSFLRSWGTLAIDSLPNPGNRYERCGSGLKVPD